VVRQGSAGYGLAVAIDALAVARLAILTSQDIITEDAREAVLQWAIETEHRKIRVLAKCAWCQSIWWAVVVLIARRFIPREWDFVARGLAFSTVAGLIAKQAEH
jgi:hypothetical protein